MFKNLKVELNDSDNLFECINNLGKSESIKLIEELLIQNKNVFSIFINKDNSYSIYSNVDINEDIISLPIIVFKEDDDLSQIYNYLKKYLELFSKTNLIINKLKEEVMNNNKKHKKNSDFLLEQIKEIEDLVYNKKEKNKIFKIINKIAKDYEYADNFRYCQIGNPLQEYFYKKSFESGCCGFYDENITLNNIEFKIGFNFGHWKGVKMKNIT